MGGRNTLAIPHPQLPYRRTKDQVEKPDKLLFPFSTTQRPWQVLLLDIIVDLPWSQDFTSTFVVVGPLTNGSIFPLSQLTHWPRNSHSFDSTCLAVTQPFFSFDVSLRSTQSIISFWQTMCRRLSVQVHCSSANWQQSDEQTERTNWTWEQYLCLLPLNKIFGWTCCPPLNLHVIICSSTIHSPFFC